MSATIESPAVCPLVFRCVKCRRSLKARSKPLRLRGCSRAEWPKCCGCDAVLVLSAPPRQLEDTAVIPALAAT